MRPLIREARPGDVPQLVTMIHSLADHLGLAGECRVSEEQLGSQLFGDAPMLFALIVERAGQVAGMATWYVTYSTWDAAHGIHVEDLYVEPRHRRQGIGVAVLTHLARVCVERGYTRLEASAVDWNTPASLFAQHGANRMDEWAAYRLTGEPLRVFAARESV